MIEITQDLQDCVDNLLELVEERDAIRRAMADVFEAELERLDVLQKEISSAGEVAKVELRKAGTGTLKVLGETFKVGKRSKTIIDQVLLLEEAKERDEIPELIRCGVLTYSVNGTQISRLDGVQKAIYGKFVDVQPATSAVTLPAHLK